MTARRIVSIGVTDDRSSVASRVRVASSFFARCAGLLGRATLEADEGMLFEPGGSVHTIGMRMRIDVAFLDRDHRVLRIVSDMRPMRFAFAPRKTRRTLEFASGKLTAHGIAVGRQLSVIETT